MAIDCGSSLVEVLALPVSFESLYYGSSAWQNQKTMQENEHAYKAAMIDRLNRIISGK